jgi:hypothetical protein
VPRVTLEEEPDDPTTFLRREPQSPDPVRMPLLGTDDLEESTDPDLVVASEPHAKQEADLESEATSLIQRPSADSLDPDAEPTRISNRVPPRSADVESAATAIINRPARSLSDRPPANPLPAVIVAEEATIPPPRGAMASDPFSEARARRRKKLRAAAMGTLGAAGLLAAGYGLGRVQPLDEPSPARPSAEIAAKGLPEAGGAAPRALEAPVDKAAPPSVETAAALAPREPTEETRPTSPPKSPRPSARHVSPAEGRSTAARGETSDARATEPPAPREISPKPEPPAPAITRAPSNAPTTADRGFVSPIRNPGF